MLIWTARFSRKKAVISVLFFGIIMVLLILLTGRNPTDSDVPQLTNNAERIAYLQSLGWDVESEPLETLQFLFPETLEEPYLSYNELQLSQGFDLTDYCGKQITRYTYAVTNYPDFPDNVQANLYICEDAPVAGDIFCLGKNGFQSPLIPDESLNLSKK